MDLILLFAALKACALAGAGLLAMLALPQSALTARRRVALLILWGLMIVPWLILPNVSMATVPLPEIAFSSTPSMVVPMLLGVWGLGTAWRLLRLVREVYGLHQRVRSSALHSQSSLAPVRCTEGLSSPCIWGIARPVILMPADATEWPREAWLAALAHEEQHLRQHDGLHRLMAALVRAIFWWNPLVHALCRRLELESELCCDEAATRGTGRRAYGELLLSLATGARFETAAAWASAGGLKERLHRLLSPAPAPDTGWWAHPKHILAVIVATALVIGCCATPSFTPLQKEAMIRLSANPFPER